ncbi:MAG: epimerase [Gemmatimonas sp.]|nr:epimerase [Gemmatimonas sp.]
MGSNSPPSFTVVLFGATGTAGTGALNACIDDARVTAVRVVTRRPLPTSHPKVHEILCTDFADLAPLADSFRGVDACLFCLGTSVRNVAGEAEYRTIHVAYALAAARALVAHSPHAAFVYLSGGGSARESRMMWARVKADAEDQLAQLPLARLASVRPGAIVPVHPRGVDRWLIAPLVTIVPALGIKADALGRAMLAAVRDPSIPSRVTLENQALRRLGAESARAV